jgi:transposase-like protein
MARRKSVEDLQKQLAFAQARKTYLATDRPRKATNDNRAKDVYGYLSTNLATATLSPIIKVQAPRKAVVFFGGATALKLVPPTDEAFEDSIPLPRGFKPAQVHAFVGDSTPTIVTAKGSLRKYIKYARSTSSENQSSYTSAVNGTTPVSTSAEQVDTVKAIATAIKTTVTEYGRVWYTPEVFTQSFV